MDQSYTIPVLTLLLLLQGVGSLFLALTLGGLYCYRRRPTLLYWALAWLCNGLWLVLGSLNFYLNHSGAAWLRHLAVVCGWLHAALWLLGMHSFRARVEKGGSDAGPVAPPQRPFPPAHAAGLLLIALAAFVLSRSLPLAERNAWLGFILAAVYAWSALVVLRFGRKVRRLAVTLLALALFLYAADRLHYGLLYLFQSRADTSSPVYASSSALVDGVAQFLAAVALLVFLLDTEQSDLRQAVARLEESEERFRLIFEHSGVGMSLLTPEGQFLQVNPALVRMLGYDAEELRGRQLADFVYRNDLTQEIPRGLLISDETPTLYEREKRYVRKDGESIWARVVRVPIRDSSGQARHYVGVLVDISARKRVEEALAASEQRYRLLNQVAHDGIHVTGEDGAFLDVNPAFCQMLGRTREELLHLTLEEVAEDTVAIRAHRHRVVQQGGDRLETRLCRPDGMAIDVEMSGARLDLEGRRLLHGICRDVTEQRQLEERLRQARKLETLGTLVGGIAHDFNNQLTAILGHLSMVQGDLKDLEEGGATFEVQPLCEPLTRAERAAQRCADITRRLLTFSSGRVEATRLVSIDGLLADTERALQRELPAAVRIQVVRGAEDGPGPWMVAGDSTQLQQVLLNLAINAGEAMPCGGTLTLSSAYRVLTESDCALQVEARPGSFVELAVADTGSGMTSEVQTRLFEPFFTTKKMGQGAGMGLAMAYGIVKAHKGWIAVESVPGQGSTFRISLPAVGDAIVSARPEAGPAAAGTGAGGPECILVVDDEDLVRCLAEAVLQRWGYRALTARDGAEAVEVYRRHAAEIDLVLLDYSMPKLTGLQAFQELQKIEPRVCVIFSSGYTMDKDSDQLLASGAKAFIPKPYRPDDLIRTVRRVLDEHACGSRSGEVSAARP